MARHIEERILDPDPGARVVVWTGHQHAMKRQPPHFPLPGPYMAGHLWEQTGIEPYCIYQLSETTWPQGRFRAWSRALPAPALLRGPLVTDLGVDAAIVHPPAAPGARPSWLYPGGGVILGQVPDHGGCLVQALDTGEIAHSTFPPRLTVALRGRVKRLSAPFARTLSRNPSHKQARAVHPARVCRTPTARAATCPGPIRPPTTGSATGWCASQWPQTSCSSGYGTE